ncbi:MAG: hypothetical protein LBU65_05120 [Planctomycetaceae bacterium]|jgi:hypothetical protein|nr:hypothetical protein [Planctomycetaceae bacterium]
MKPLTYILTIALILSFAELSLAQRGRRRPPRPDAAAAPADSPRGDESAEITPAEFDESLATGTPPALWEIDANRRDEELRGLLRSSSIAPSVPAKVIRYATWLLAHYDTDGNGKLSGSEWMKMPASPQSIDLNGDSVIAFDELVRHIAVYGDRRTIHNPNPAPILSVSPVVTNSLHLFRPVDLPSFAALTPKPNEPAVAAANDVTEKELDKPDAAISPEEAAAGRQVPQEKKFYRTPEELRGLPAWFILNDHDGDGQLTMIEFSPSLSPASIALFGRLDKNNDGILTADEVRGRQSTAAPEHAPVTPAKEEAIPPEVNENKPDAEKPTEKTEEEPAQ